MEAVLKGMVSKLLDLAYKVRYIMRRSVENRNARLIPFCERRIKMLERVYQAGLIKRIKRRLIGAIVLKTNPDYIQGIPDLLVLYDDKWAALEVKRFADSHRQPNQDYYINLMNEMSFAAVIYPENEEVVLDAMECTFRDN